MPVNTAALKSFAPAMRRQLIEAVGRKLDLLLTSQTPDTLSTYASQIAELRERATENREQLLEEVAYSWFNRLAALRYLDAKGWHPFGCKVLMPAGEGETQPELLKLMRSGSLPLELKEHANESRLNGLLDGQIPTAIAGADPQGEVYRELVLAVCRSYHQLLPTLFEGLDDATELLLPDDQITDGSIAGAFRSQISDDDCDDVEIIGWLYQFYISEKKDQVIGKVVKSEDIPAATQLFTPNWIVKYMVQNSLGAQWLATYPDSALKGQMEYYIEPADQTEEVKAQLAAITPDSLNPEETTLIDPACGSGHILVEAYELFKAIYLERGYQQREIPQLILEKNLFGLDIDQRAAQLTSFALMMKGRGDDRRLFERGIKLNVMALVNSDGFDADGLANAVNLSEYSLKLADLVELKQLFEYAKTFGSLIEVPNWLGEKLPGLRRLSELKTQNIIAGEAFERLEQLVRQAEFLAAYYDVVVANPPYMSSKGINSQVKSFLKIHFPAGQKDVFAAFAFRCMTWAASETSAIGLVTPNSWMYLSSFALLREHLFKNSTVDVLVELETNAFEPAMVTVCSFVFSSRRISRYRGSYIRLSTFKGARNQAPRTLEAIRDRKCGWLFEAEQDEYRKIPGSPVAYWANPRVLELFDNYPALSDNADTAIGLFTCDNARFVRQWWEVGLGTVEGSPSSKKFTDGASNKWHRYNKGGGYRRWFGANTEVVNLENNAAEIRQHRFASGQSISLPGERYFFSEGINWSMISSIDASFRYFPSGMAFDMSSPSLFSDSLHSALAALNSNLSTHLLNLINPTLNLSTGTVCQLPDLFSTLSRPTSAACLISLVRSDWDAYERSWDFQSLPLLTAFSEPPPTLESSYTAWIAKNKESIAEIQRLEEENNYLFIDAYGLQDELSSEVPIEQITLTVNPAYRYGGNLTDEELWYRFRQDTIKEFLSYTTGCIMGRYGLDQPGLILADSRESQAAQLADYEEKVGKPLAQVQFQPDSDGIIPVLDGEWFEDDIVARSREFLAVTFPESSVADNLRFIEDSLGKDIRKYFCSEFYKDHLQTYKKRPIYWMVQSPKKGFSCLIYLHRYTKDTLNLVLNNYFRPYLQKLEARLAQLGLDQLNDDLPTRERTAARKEAEKITKVLKECQAWEQDALLPLAQQRIELDLDDGVKVNYLKLQDVLATIPGLAAKED